MHLLSSFLIGVLLLLCSISTRSASAELIEELTRIKQRNGAAPTAEQFYQLVEDSKLKLLTPEGVAALQHLKSLQHPSIEPRKLAAIMKAKRDSIVTIYIKYHVAHENHPSGLRTESITYAESGVMEYVRATNQVDAGSKRIVAPNLVMAFDDMVVRRYEESNPPRAEIRVFDQGLHLELIQLHTNPLVQAMMSEWATIGDKPQPITDLYTYFMGDHAIIFEQPETVDSVRCIMGSFGFLFAVYLDPERDYALLRRESFSNASGKRLLRSRVDFSDLQDCGGGLWLPRKFTKVLFDQTGKREYSMEVTVDTLKVNQGVEGLSFTDGIFPEGVEVTDWRKP